MKCANEGRIKAVQCWVLENLPHQHGVNALAGRAAMSVRHFTRVFREQTGMTPRVFVEEARTSLAARLLANSDMPLKRVASRSGFLNVNVMRAAFMRQFGVGPQRYRLRARA